MVYAVDAFPKERSMGRHDKPPPAALHYKRQTNKRTDRQTNRRTSPSRIALLALRAGACLNVKGERKGLDTCHKSYISQTHDQQRFAIVASHLVETVLNVLEKGANC